MTEQAMLAELLGINEDNFICRVKTDAMTGTGILTGDYVIVRQQDTAEDGQIVVALIGDEAAVRRYHRTAEGVRLEATNDKIEPIVAAEVKVLGLVVSVMRTIA